MNSIYTIIPYRWHGPLWYFDDNTTHLKREAFMQGISEIIDSMVKHIPFAKEGFLLTFSETPFPGHTKTLKWIKGDSAGNWYKDIESEKMGWLCPALYKYFEEAPKFIYARADSLFERKN